jgi:hypothetical protein
VRKPDELCFLGVSSESKFSFGHQVFSGAHVQGLQQAKDKESGGFAYFKPKNFPKCVRPR